MTPPRSRRTAAIVVAAGLLLGGCGIGTQDQPQDVPAEEVPYHLLDPTAPTVPVAGGDVDTVALYFVDGARLDPVFRRVPVGSSLEEILEALVAGPTTGEQSAGLVSTVTDAQTIRGVSTSRGVATVDLGPAPSDVPSDEQTLAVAQIVFTLTAQPGIGRVGFTIEGDPIEVADGTGALTSAPLARDDFASLAPEPG